MNRVNDQQWLVANQQFLMASLQIVQEELQAYHSRKKEDAATFGFEPSPQALNALENARQALTAPAAIDTLAQIFNLSPFERKILLMCAGVELTDDFGHLISKLQGNPELAHPSFNLAIAAFSDAHWSAISPSAPLRYWNLIQLKSNTLIAKSPLLIDEHILHYLTGFHHLDERLNAVLKPIQTFSPLVASQEVLVNHILQSCLVQNQSSGMPIIQLEGDEQGDQLAIAAAVAAGLGQELYHLPVYSIPEKGQESGQLQRLWNREAALNQYALFIDSSALDSNDKNRIQSLIHFVEGISGILILGQGEWTARLSRPLSLFKVEKPTQAEQLLLWREQLGKSAKLINDYLENVVSHFNLSAKTIVEASAEVVSQQPKPIRRSKAYIAATEARVWQTCCKHTRPKVDELAQRLEPVATWQDIVLPKSQTETLKEIAQQVKNRRKVYQEWGFGSKSSRGFGISALFTGESGTGKTMASEVLANELQLDLYRIDLSQVVNKYIGETEKNLKRIFDAAEEGGAILLFDEADALFGKRSDVKDSHDRYSNIEVSYLLQRMENYRGLAILTTNMKSAIDKAFLRRIRFIIHFTRPDQQLRAEIWKRIFPADTPLDKNLDPSKLAMLNVPGGNIRNVAMNAAFLAAAENKPVQMAHILHAAHREYTKLEKTLSRNEIKGWVE